MISTILPGSMVDTKPVLRCNWCLEKKAQSGGVMIGQKFKCAMCFRRRHIANLNKKRYAERERNGTNDSTE